MMDTQPGLLLRLLAFASLTLTCPGPESARCTPLPTYAHLAEALLPIEAA